MATRRPPTRGVIVDIALVVLGGAQVATTLVTLAESPFVVREIAERVLAWRSKTTTDQAVIRVMVSGPKGRIDLELNDATSPEDIARVIELAMKDKAGALGA